jgi:hypothetical protein
VTSLDPSKLLAAIPQGLRDPLIETYREIASNFAEHRWEPSELNGGKFCKCVYSICHGFITGTYAAKPTKPPNMRDDCRALEGLTATGKSGDRSLRILVPRLLPALYEIRNNRGVGHIGGDVNPNLMDATAVYSMTSWIMAELIRVLHTVTTNEAQEAVDALSERKLPLVWSPSGDLKRVLDTSLSAADQTLLILHQSLAWVDDDQLFNSVEYSNRSVYRNKVLGELHKNRLIELERDKKRARISPKGSSYVAREIVAPRMGWKKTVR